MDWYQRVEKPKEETPINENEIRITSQGRMRNCIIYATTLLQEKGSDEIVLKAMGRAISKTVMIAALIKRRIVGLHQITLIGSNDITDMWEPLEERLPPLETTRHVSMIIITLSKKELDTSSTGYQPPLPADQVKPLNAYEEEGDGSSRMRGRGRGGRGRGRGNVNGGGEYNGDGWDGGRGYGGRGRGRSRGRGFRGRGWGYGGVGSHLGIMTMVNLMHHLSNVAAEGEGEGAADGDLIQDQMGTAGQPLLEKFGAFKNVYIGLEKDMVAFCAWLLIGLPLQPWCCSFVFIVFPRFQIIDLIQ